MAEIRIGHSQVYAEQLGLGANAVGGHNLFDGLEDETGKQVVRTALNSGINLIDTAYAYGNGRSEELIGEVLKEKNMIVHVSSLLQKLLMCQIKDEHLTIHPSFSNNRWKTH